MLTIFLINLIIGLLTSVVLAKIEYPDGFFDNVTILELFKYIAWSFAGIVYTALVIYKVLQSDLADKTPFKK